MRASDNHARNARYSSEINAKKYEADREQCHITRDTLSAANVKYFVLFAEIPDDNNNHDERKFLFMLR